MPKDTKQTMQVDLNPNQGQVDVQQQMFLHHQNQQQYQNQQSTPMQYQQS